MRDGAGDPRAYMGVETGGPRPRVGAGAREGSSVGGVRGAWVRVGLGRGMARAEGARFLILLIRNGFIGCPYDLYRSGHIPAWKRTWAGTKRAWLKEAQSQIGFLGAQGQK